MILDNINKIRYRIRSAAERRGLDPEGIGIVAVIKYAEPAQIRELVEIGLIGSVGESRVQQALAHRKELGPLAGRVQWRMIGHLQTNKAGQAMELFDSVDSLDNLRLAQALDRRAAELGRRSKTLVQVKLTEKETQSGVRPEHLEEFLAALSRHAHLEVGGLMAIAPMLESVEDVRPYFRSMKQIFDRFFAGREEAQLSMGMSRDFELAVEEGATLVRIGTSLFNVQQQPRKGGH
ncbi:MAG: YggS family pyridoxal phosphate-dependent enzyme [Elusimicrobia bacterium]|nr:YggS family pyridoxal phosphate-dependent enzyme [Elusimicrobiota bacterium]